jgi:hypothetical protein
MDNWRAVNVAMGQNDLGWPEREKLSFEFLLQTFEFVSKVKYKSNTFSKSAKFELSLKT